MGAKVRFFFKKRCSFSRFFVTLASPNLLSTRKSKKKNGFLFALFSFFRNFVRILSFSLYKGSLGD